jgi:orotate phosphoribosyltransferase
MRESQRDQSREENPRTMTSRSTLARDIFQTSHLHGEFLLRSGTVSNEYFDKYLFEADPALLKRIATEMAALVPRGTDALAGLELGGVPIATMLSQITGIPALFVRKKAKEYGTRKLAEGGELSGRNVVIVEDVVTSGGQILQSAAKLRERGARIACVLCVIDREAGGPENLAKDGLELRPLFTMSELKKS